MRRLHGEAGASTVEMVVVVPIIAIVALLVVGLGRTAAADGQVSDAARSAARAASLAASPADAVETGRAAGLAALDGRCAAATVVVDTDAFTAGGQVSVTVDCTVSLSDVVVTGLPGRVHLSDTAVSPIEQLRQVG